MYNGVINIYKEKGYTSHDVVARLRGILKMKKIGHTGTLDPDAQGVLPVCLGSATRLCGMLTDKEKIYEAVLLLGRETDTQDISGHVLSEHKVTVSEAEVKSVIKGFVGPYEQIPPMYSALKVDGKKLYELAREGRVIERKARPVEIYEIDILEMTLPRVRMRVRCSKGTYIRTLCHDIGEKLSCKGCMEELLRTKAGCFLIEEAVTLDKVEQLVKAGQIEEYILAADKVLGEYPACTVKEEFTRFIYNGNPFLPEDLENETEMLRQGMVRVYDSKGKFVAVYEYRNEKGMFCPVKMFFN